MHSQPANRFTGVVSSLALPQLLREDFVLLRDLANRLLEVLVLLAELSDLGLYAE